MWCEDRVVDCLCDWYCVCFSVLVIVWGLGGEVCVGGRCLLLSCVGTWGGT